MLYASFRPRVRPLVLDLVHGQRSDWLDLSLHHGEPLGRLPWWKMPEGQEVPTWDGDPSHFENFATSCKWYVCSSKESDRRLAAPRIWQKLQGAAKSIVRNLDPKDYDVQIPR